MSAQAQAWLQQGEPKIVLGRLALDEARPRLRRRVTIWPPAGRVKVVETVNDLYAFLATGDAAILTTPDEIETWDNRA